MSLWEVPTPPSEKSNTTLGKKGEAIIKKAETILKANQDLYEERLYFLLDAVKTGKRIPVGLSCNCGGDISLHLQFELQSEAPRIPGHEERHYRLYPEGVWKIKYVACSCGIMYALDIIEERLAFKKRALPDLSFDFFKFEAEIRASQKEAE